MGAKRVPPVSMARASVEWFRELGRPRSGRPAGPGRRYFFRGSSAGLTNVMSVGPTPCTWTNVS